MSAIDKGQLVRIKFRRNLAAREEALASIWKVPGTGKWRARIGGRMRGRTAEFSTRARAEAAVNDHYNGVMMEWLKGGGARG